MIVAASILAANFANLLKDVKKIEKSGAEYLHIDVMDGHFVPNISFGKLAYNNIRKDVRMVFDVHLMIDYPYRYAKDFIEAGADIVTFHYECQDNSLSTINEIKSLGAKVGMSIKPKTEVEVLEPYLKMLDLVLVMSVEPGFGGQKFMNEALDKIKYLAKMKKDYDYDYVIEVDGGINYETAKLCAEAGCEIVVAGTYIFNATNPSKAVKELKNI